MSPESAHFVKQEQMSNIFFGGSVFRSGVFHVGCNLPGLAALEALTSSPLHRFCPATQTLSGHPPNRRCRSSSGIQGPPFSAGTVYCDSCWHPARSKSAPAAVTHPTGSALSCLYSSFFLHRVTTEGRFSSAWSSGCSAVSSALPSMH